jgi:16S rRNA (uracil1498-N3)-methyltransferase
VHLGFAEPKGKRLDWLLEKATELGAAAIAPVRFARSVAGGDALTENRRDRWTGHCVAAAKQCGLDFLPELAEPLALGDFLAAHGNDLCLLGDPGASAVSMPAALGGWCTGRRICLLVGPEGGLTSQEREEAVAAGFIPACLGSTTLRIETAALAMLAAVMAICEDKGPR